MLFPQHRKPVVLLTVFPFYRNKLSRHCLICDKCVVDYDHHCRWLNNCIGEANYKTFIMLIVSTSVLMVIHLVVSGALLIEYLGEMEKLKFDLAAESIDMDETFHFSVLCLNGLLGLAILMMVAHLVGFHIYLAYHGLTTYNYVMLIQAEEQRANAYLESDSDLESITTEECDTGDASPGVTAGGPNEDEMIVSTKITAGAPEIEKQENIPGQLTYDDDLGPPPTPTYDVTPTMGDIKRGGIVLPPITSPSMPQKPTM